MREPYSGTGTMAWGSVWSTPGTPGSAGNAGEPGERRERRESGPEGHENLAQALEPGRTKINAFSPVRARKPERRGWAFLGKTTFNHFVAL